MYRSIFFNCWMALIAFTIYFVYTIYSTGGFASPIPTILFSALWGITGFVVAYGIRALLDYILYTPEVPSIEIPDNMEESPSQQANVTTDESSFNRTSTVEFQDESSEDIAQVVRTMLNRDEPSMEK